ncbi:MAG TPA: hypothetical protein VJZ71_16595 [Phycisphaerae bacterium]|nr:hypothetical protein [Phycisphaerae bacterium]
MWFEIFAQLGRFGIGVAAIGWLTRTIVVHFLNKDVAKYRVELGHAHDIEMERLRNDLQLVAIEHEVRFRSVYERQAMVIARTYQKLSELHAAVANYARFLTMGDEPDLETKRKIVFGANDAFRDYYFPRRIFLPADTAQRVTDVSNTIVTLANTFTRLQRPAPENASLDLDERFDEIKESIDPALDALEKEFRTLLGMTSEPQDPKTNDADPMNGSKETK